ncbi:MAG: rhodanese-like domain-containing protein [Corynebacterium sp.]|uniref:rhodanese-like domain-containing protein n=1 Tax=Corynebacterium sp. TaxID=1720 RepID=UPI0026DF491C|nr:rhodanese-like domain-containing protein [Corynebacterium sp.]MDO5669386.1 rhodanese-like domain-containing protein [Corynebacterium sp.]
MKSVNVTQVPSDAQLIDVREADEFAEVHAAGATLIPLSEFADRVSELDTERDIYLICRSGGRSVKACDFLKENHDIEAINVEGGTLAWVEKGLPTE